MKQDAGEDVIKLLSVHSPQNQIALHRKFFIEVFEVKVFKEKDFTIFKATQEELDPVGYNIPPPARAKFGVSEIGLVLDGNHPRAGNSTPNNNKEGEYVVKESLQNHQYECSGVQQQSDQVWLPDGLIQCTGICSFEMEEASICVRTHTNFHAPKECAGFHMTGN